MGLSFILFPVFGGVMPRQKLSLSMALRVENFRALCGKYYPSIDRLDSRNGRQNIYNSQFTKYDIIE